MPEVTCPAIVFSVSYIGDLVTAALTLDIIARPAAPAVVVAAPNAAPLLAGDKRVSALRLVRSSRPLVWRAEVLRELWRARRLGARVVNLEVYAPRWRFVQRLVNRLGLACQTLDLPALLADNARSAVGQPTLRRHRSRYYAEAVGVAGAAPGPRLELDADEVVAVRARLEALGQPALGSLVVVHPGCSDARRRTETERLAGVLARLVAARRARVALVGIPSEAALTASLRASLRPHVEALDLCGLLDVRGLAALIASADLFVGGDSGPLKIAEALGVRTLSFWTPGSPSPAFAGPLGSGHVMLPASCLPQQAAEAGLQLLAG